MQPVFFEGSIEIGKPEGMTDEQCMSTWALISTDENGYRHFTQAWKPSYEDIQAINRGEPIYIDIITAQLPPIGLFTVDENGNCNDAL